MAEKNKSNELYINRLFDAPVKLVWDAWTDPKQVAQWWGPRGFKITTHKKEVKTGGVWDYIMHGPDGVDYPNSTKFLEVEKYSYMIYDHGGYANRPPMFRVTVCFYELGDQTLMEMTMAFPTPEIATESKKFIKRAGGNSTWDRLDEYLTSKIKSQDHFVICRTFDAPIDLMFKMWTDPNHFSQWIPPTGATMQFRQGEIKPGHTLSYSMIADGNLKMFGKMKFLEIKKPNRLIYSQIFCDENGNISRHPMAPTWPEAMLTTVTLTKEGDRQTQVHIRWEVYGKASDLEKETFHKSKDGMTEGWSGSFDKLEEYLSAK